MPCPRTQTSKQCPTLRGDKHDFSLLRMTLFFHNFSYYPPPDKVGAGGIGVASDVCLSRVRMFAFRSRSRTPKARPLQQKQNVDFYNFSDPKNNIHSVQICINSRWQTINKMGQLLSKFLKRAQEKQSESSSQLCTISVYGEVAAPLSKPHEYSLNAAAREKGVTF